MHFLCISPQMPKIFPITRNCMIHILYVFFSQIMNLITQFCLRDHELEIYLSQYMLNYSCCCCRHVPSCHLQRMATLWMNDLQTIMSHHSQPSLALVNSASFIRSIYFIFVLPLFPLPSTFPSIISEKLFFLH